MLSIGSVILSPDIISPFINAIMHCLQVSRKLSWRGMWRNHMLLVRVQAQSWLAHLPQIVKVERQQEQIPLRLHQTGRQTQRLQEQRSSTGEEAGIISCHQVCQLGVVCIAAV